MISFIVWVPPCKIIQNVFSCFPDWSAEFIFCFFALFPRKISAVFSPGGDLPVSYFSIFFSKCKQFSFACVNKIFNDKVNYSERKIIKNNFFENNVHMKINKVNANIKMCLHDALCFWLGHADRYSNHVIRISVVFCWWEDGRKSWKQRAVRDSGWTYGLRCSGDRRAYRQNFCWSCRRVRRNRLPHRGSRIRSNSSLKRERANFS